MKNPYLLEFIVFTCGAVVMILELVGSRIVAPFIGTSIFVWTSLIGVILGSLSLGYWWGGKLADKKPSWRLFSLIIFTPAVFISATAFSNLLVLQVLQSLFTDIRIEAIIAALILFAPASILLGMVSPYAARLKLTDMTTAGSTVGSLYAISTIGSITGTFLAGFFLISFLGSTTILYALAFTLVIVSLLASIHVLTSMRIGFMVFILFYIVYSHSVMSVFAADGFKDIDTNYNRVWIINTLDPYTNKPIKLLRINDESSSAVYVNSDDLVFPYTKFYHLAQHFKPEINHALMIGGAAYSYPKEFLKRYPNSRIDVVEIDPQLTEIAKQEFNLQDNPRLTVYHEDARVFLNKTDKKYDVIYGDAFKSRVTPFQLATKEAVARMFDVLHENGVAIVNFIGTLEGDKSRFIQAEYATYSSVFPQVYLFPVQDPDNPHFNQNIVLIALKSQTIPAFTSSNEELNNCLSHLWRNDFTTNLPVLTDNFAPIEHYAADFSTYTVTK